jgi:hypothetical protein
LTGIVFYYWHSRSSFQYKCCYWAQLKRVNTEDSACEVQCKKWWIFVNLRSCYVYKDNILRLCNLWATGVSRLTYWPVQKKIDVLTEFWRQHDAEAGGEYRRIGLYVVAQRACLYRMKCEGSYTSCVDGCLSLSLCTLNRMSNLT